MRSHRRQSGPKRQQAQQDDNIPEADAESAGLALLDGEYATNVVKPILFALARRRGGGSEFEGALHITNFRLALECAGPGKANVGSGDESLKWTSFPLSSVKNVVQADDDAQAITLTAKDLRSCRMLFPSHNGVFVATLTQIILSMAGFAQTSPEKSFAFAHARATSRRRRATEEDAVTPEETGAAESATKGMKAPLIHTQEEEPDTVRRKDIASRTPSTARRRTDKLEDNSIVDGWLAYDLEAEFVRQGVISPKSLDSPVAATGAIASAEKEALSSAGDKAEELRWRLFYNRSHGLVPTYPPHFIVPAGMSDGDIRAVAAYRSKGRLPAVTWMDPKTQAVLARSAQPLAGLGGKSCAEDERLLSYFRQQGKASQPPPLPPPPPPPPLPPAPSIAQNLSAPHPSASPEVVLRRVDIAPKPAIDDIAERRREARAHQKRESSESNGRSPSQLYVADVMAGMLDNGNRADVSPRDGEKTSGARRQSGSRNEGTKRHSLQNKSAKTSQVGANSQSRPKSTSAIGGKSKSKTGDGKDEVLSSLLDMVKMPQWSTPWSLTPVAVQSEENQEPLAHARDTEELVPTEGQNSWQLGKSGITPQTAARVKLPAMFVNGPVPAQKPTGWSMGGTRQGRGTPENNGGGGTEGDDGQPRLCVLDARTAVAAIGNQFFGKGVETGQEYGGSTQLVFSGIGNIHAVKDAFEELRNALDPLKGPKKDESASTAMLDIMSRGLGLAKALDLSQALGEELEEGGMYTLWPRLIRQIMASSLLAARLLRLTGCSVLVHCSDGWDRTPQICATTQLLLDPYFRTLDGFCVLIEKEWLSFGHKFWARCMGGTHENAQDSPTNERASPGSSPMRAGSGGAQSNGNVKPYDELSPVFLQFLDVVHNVVAQFPAAFEYTEELLGFVADHTFSGLYGTFLCDTERRRKRLKLKERTMSIWAVVLSNSHHFTNPGYVRTEDPLWPSLAHCKIRLWERQHCRVPALRPHHALATQKLDDCIVTTVRLSNGNRDDNVL